MKSMKKALSLVLSLIMAFSVLTVAAVNAGAYEQDNGKHYIAPAGDSLTNAALFAVGETVYGTLLNSEHRFYKVINTAVRDIEFSVRTDKKIEFTVSIEGAAQFTVGETKYSSYNADIAANTPSTITLKGAPVGTYYVQIDGSGADDAKTEFSFNAYCAGLPALALRINNKTAKMVSGDTLSLQLSDMNVNYLNYYWESVDDSKTADIDESKIVTVNEDGIVSVAFPSSENKFTKTINVTVRAVFYYSTGRTLTDAVTKSCVITAEPANVILDPYVTELKLGTNVTRTIKATTNVKNAAIDWSSSDEEVATVSKQGTIHTGTKNGTATITAAVKYNGTVLKVRREISIIVDTNIKNASAVAFKEKNVTLRVGEGSKDLECVITYSDGTTSAPNGDNIVFTSSDEKIVAVSKTGRVTPVAEGSATITATTKDGGFIDTCTVKVDAAWPTWLQVLIKPVQAVIQLLKIIYNFIKSKT